MSLEACLPRILVLAVAVTTFVASAQAHRIDADCDLSPDDSSRLWIEVWYGDGGTPETGTVKVLHPDGNEFAAGRLVSGRFEFTPAERVPYIIVVQTGAGHARRFSVPQEVLDRMDLSTPPPSPADGRIQARAIGDRSGRSASPADGPGLIAVLAGLSLIFSASAFLTAWGNRKRIRRLEQGRGE